VKVALIGASGQAGSRLLAELSARGHTVTAIARHPEKIAVRESGVKRYFVVGGAGSLEVAPGVRLIDTPQFPTAYKAEASKGAEFLELLRTTTGDLDWTFLSPSAMFAPGERTGKFRIGKDQLLTNDNGSSISFEDYAIAAVDELEKPAHIRERFTVGY